MPFPFLNLPGELRNKVYDLALTPRGLEEVSSEQEKPVIQLLLTHPPSTSSSEFSPDIFYPHTSNPVAGIGLLRVNRQVYNEAVTILYGTYRFSPHSPPLGSHLDRVLDIAGFASRVRHLKIAYPAFVLEAPIALRHFTALETLQITTHNPSTVLGRPWTVRDTEENIGHVHDHLLAANVRVTLLVPGKREDIGTRESLPVMRLARSFGWSTRRVSSRFNALRDPNPVVHGPEDGVEPGVERSGDNED